MMTQPKEKVLSNSIRIKYEIFITSNSNLVRSDQNH